MKTYSYSWHTTVEAEDMPPVHLCVNDSSKELVGILKEQWWPTQPDRPTVFTKHDLEFTKHYLRSFKVYRIVSERGMADTKLLIVGHFTTGDAAKAALIAALSEV